MKLNKAISLKEETVAKCLNYFKEIYNRPKDIEQAKNRKIVAEKETGHGKPYYENSDRKTFFNDLNVTIGKITDKAVKTKFTDYLRAYISNSPEDGYICGSDEDARNKQKFEQNQKDRELFKDQTTKTYNNKAGLFDHELVY